LTAVALAGCGGTKGSGAVGSPPGGLLENVNLSQSVQNLQSLNSFRFDLSMKVDVSGAGPSDPFAAAILGALGDIKASGAVVAPDQAEVNATLLGQQFAFIQVGDKAWLKTGAAWKAVQGPDLDFGLDFNDLLTQVLPDSVLKVAKTSREKVNGVDAVHYSFDKKALSELATELGQTADLSEVDTVNLDVWLGPGNVPVKVAMSVSGADEDGQKVSMAIEMNVTDINDPSIKVRPPA
jgi:hypothetical protein